VSRKKDGLFEILSNSPWWVGVVFSAISYIAMKFVFPAIYSDHRVFSGIVSALSSKASLIALILLIPAFISAVRSITSLRLFKRQRTRYINSPTSGNQSIQNLNWKQFEQLIAEAYRQQGYSVEENHQLGADGGVDVRLFKDGEYFLVQCKHWKTQNIGVKTIREMYGLLISEKAFKVIIVTSGFFSSEAKTFALGKPIQLIDRKGLEQLIGGLLPKSAQEKKSAKKTTNSVCPRCGGHMIPRLAKKGVNAGSKFYGCSSFPKCRYTLPI
jgi:restriction system protein